jgi:hypothetical protein
MCLILIGCPELTGSSPGLGVMIVQGNNETSSEYSQWEIFVWIMREGVQESCGEPLVYNTSNTNKLTEIAG